MPTSFIISTMPTTPVSWSRPTAPATRSESESHTMRTQSIVEYQVFLSTLPKVAGSTANTSP